MKLIMNDNTSKTYYSCLSLDCPPMINLKCTTRYICICAILKKKKKVFFLHGVLQILLNYSFIKI